MPKQELSLNDISERIYFIRGHRVLLDTDFMFQLSEDEYDSLRSQIVILNEPTRGKHTKYLPFVFTEQGVSMLSSVLRSKTAIQVNVEIMRTFVKLRSILETNKDIAKKLEQLEQKFSLHDHQFKVVFDAIRKLMATGSPVTQKKIKGLND